jgi:hypothetical protein
MHAAKRRYDPVGDYGQTSSVNYVTATRILFCLGSRFAQERGSDQRQEK